MQDASVLREVPLLCSSRSNRSEVGATIGSEYHVYACFALVPYFHRQVKFSGISGRSRQFWFWEWTQSGFPSAQLVGFTHFNASP